MTTTELGRKLDRDVCLRLLATVQVGRLIYTAGALPAVEPVRFVVDGETVVFRATYADKITSLGEDPVVAFQADEFDPDTAAGWSVTAVGTVGVLCAVEAARYCPTQLQPLVRAAAGHQAAALQVQLVNGVRIA